MWVRSPSHTPNNALIAQLVEHRIEDPSVRGSTPRGCTKLLKVNMWKLDRSVNYIKCRKCGVGSAVLDLHKGCDCGSRDFFHIYKDIFYNTKSHKEKDVITKKVSFSL